MVDEQDETPEAEAQLIRVYGRQRWEEVPWTRGVGWKKYSRKLRRVFNLKGADWIMQRKWRERWIKVTERPLKLREEEEHRVVILKKGPAPRPGKTKEKKQTREEPRRGADTRGRGGRRGNKMLREEKTRSPTTERPTREPLTLTRERKMVMELVVEEWVQWTREETVEERREATKDETKEGEWETTGKQDHQSEEEWERTSAIPEIVWDWTTDDGQGQIREEEEEHRSETEEERRNERGEEQEAAVVERGATVKESAEEEEEPQQEEQPNPEKEEQQREDKEEGNRGLQRERAE
jgi:hypothetical protein